MTALVLVALFALVLVLLGAMLGAEIQDKLHEGQRRRHARNQQAVNARWRAMTDDGRSFELNWPTERLVIPVPAHADDSD